MLDTRLLSLVPGAVGPLAASVVLHWLALVANIALFFVVGSFVGDLLAGAVDEAAVGRLMFASALAIVVRMACQASAQMMGQKAAALAKRTVRQAVYDKLVALGPTYREHVATSEAVQISVEGAEQLETYFGSYLPQLFYAAVAPITLFACLAPTCLPAAAVLLACVPLIPLSIVAVQRVAKRTMRRYWGSYTDLGALFLESIEGLTTLKIYRADAAQHARMNEEAETFRRATMRLLRMQLNSITVMDLFAFGGAAAGIAVLAWQFSLGAVSFAGAFAMVFLSAEFFLPLRALGSFFHTAMNGMAAAERMYEVLDAPEPPSGEKEVDLARPDVACRNVGYSYDGARSVLSGIDFEAPAGSFIGITGPSGSGKSTLAGVIAGANGGFTGEVLVGGVDVREASRESLRRAVTTVSFHSYLFKGTVRSNLLLAKPGATDGELWRALERARVAGFVRNAGGLDAPVEADGGNLSGGQRQRIALARAVLRDTPVYVFDEATSNVDAESESAIIDFVHELAREKTVIMVSHRLSALQRADQVYVLEAGCVVERGAHDELLARGGTYARLWEGQEGLERLARADERGHACAGEREETRADEREETRVEPLEWERACQGREHAGARPARVWDESDGEGAQPAGGAPAAERDVTGSALHDAPGARKRRSHLLVMARLVLLTRPLVPVMAAAVALGVAGFLAAIFLTVLAAYALLDIAGVAGGIGASVAVGGVIACGVLRGPLRYGEQLCNHYLAFKVLAIVRDRIFAKLRQLAPAKLEGKDKGDLVSLVTSDVELLEVFYAHTLSPALIALVVSVGMAAFIGAHSLVLGALALASYALVGIALPWASSKASGTGGRDVREGVGALNTYVLDSLRGLGETLQFGRASDRSRELGRRMGELAVAERALKGRAAISLSAVGAIVMACDMAMLLAASWLVMAGAIELGAAIVAVSALMSSFGPVIAVANLGSTLQQTLAAGARVLDLLKEEPETPEVVEGVAVDRFRGARTRGASFSYGGARVLEDVSLSIPRGSVVQIAGRSGSGKSTLLKLLMRFWDVGSGAVEISGADVRNVTTASLRGIEGFMTQDTHLFAGTIRDNLFIARQDADDAAVREAVRKAALDGFVDKLPRGLDTPVGELGDALSGGERQRVGLARVFLHDAPFVLLDEPTSNLDALNEAAVLRALSDNKAGKTIVLVSHRPSASKVADVRYSVERGRVS